MQGPSKKMIRVEQLTKVYRQDSLSVRALGGVDLEIGSGEFTALVGPSGSGKTTLLNLVGGLDAPTSGRIWIGEQDIGELSAHRLSNLRLRKIGFVFQEYNLIPVLTVLENVEYVMLIQKVSRDERQARSLQVLREVGLEGLEKRRPRELSGGQQQRVAVARAIVAGPLVVLADEPTANLDSRAADELMALFVELNEHRNTTFVIATHDQRVMAYAKRLIKMLDGRIVDDIEQHAA